MQILVTGASGRIGRYVVKELVNAGHNVTGVDVLPAEGGISPFLRVDLADAGEVYQALAVAEAGGSSPLRCVGECGYCS